MFPSFLVLQGVYHNRKIPFLCLSKNNFSQMSIESAFAQTNPLENKFD